MTVLTPGWSRIHRSANCAVVNPLACAATLRAAHPDLERHATEGLPHVEGLTLAVVGAVVLRRESRGFAVLARQEPAGQRHARDDADAGLQGGRQDPFQ